MAQGPASVYIKDAKFMLTVDPQRRLLDDTSCHPQEIINCGLTTQCMQRLTCSTIS